MNKKEEERMLEQIYNSLMTDNWKQNTLDLIKPYKRALEIIQMLEACINKNDLFLSKKLISTELKNVKGITEQKCIKRKLKKDYCKHCKNSHCNMNTK